MKVTLGRKYRAKFEDSGCITRGRIYTAVKNMYYDANNEEIFCFVNDLGAPDCIALTDKGWEEVKLTPLNELIYEIEQDVTAV